MRKLAYLLGDLFKDANRSIEDTSAGFLAHNLLLQGLDDPQQALAAKKAETQALAERLMQVEAAIGSGQAQQQTGRSLTQDEQARALHIIRENEAALRSRYVVKDDKTRLRLYHLFYPQKMEPYNAASLQTLPGLVRTYLTLAEEEKDQLGPDIYTHTMADLTPFAAARESQTRQQQATSKARKDRQALLDALTEQLTANLHGLCDFFRTEKSQVLTYFNPRYFEVQLSARPGHYLARVAPRHTNQVLDVLEAQVRYTQVQLGVQEGGELCFFRGDDGQTPVPADALRVHKGAPRTLPLAQLPGTGALLLAHNGTAYVGHYVAELS